MALHIRILGAGLAGRLCALYLTEPARHWPQPLRLSLYDNATGRGAFTVTAGKVAAAMLCPAAESAVLPAALLPQASQSLQLWHQLQIQLPELWLQQRGCLLLSHPQQQAQLQQLVSRLHGAEGPPAQRLDGAQLAVLEPVLAGRFSQSWYCPQDGQTDSRSFFRASTRLLTARGIRFKQLSATANGPDQLAKMQAGCDLLLDCRGLGALPDWPALRPIRGEVLRLRCTELSLTRPVRFYHPRYSLYVAPKARQQFVVGATELESASQQGTSVRSALELLSALYALHPGFAEAEILRLDASARPALPAATPQVRLHQGVIQLNGLSRHGYLLGPAFAQQAANLAHSLLCH